MFTNSTILLANKTQESIKHREDNMSQLWNMGVGVVTSQWHNRHQWPLHSCSLSVPSARNLGYPTSVTSCSWSASNPQDQAYHNQWQALSDQDHPLCYLIKSEIFIYNSRWSDVAVRIGIIKARKFTSHFIMIFELTRTFWSLAFSIPIPTSVNYLFHVCYNGHGCVITTLTLSAYSLIWYSTNRGGKKLLRIWNNSPKCYPSKFIS